MQYNYICKRKERKVTRARVARTCHVTHDRVWSKFLGFGVMQVNPLFGFLFSSPNFYPKALCVLGFGVS